MSIAPENQRFAEAVKYLYDQRKIKSLRDMALQLRNGSNNLRIGPQDIYDLLPPEKHPDQEPKHKPTSKILNPLENIFEISKSYILTGKGEMLNSAFNPDIKEDRSNCEEKISELIKSGELFYASHVKSLQADRDEILKENALLEARVKELESQIVGSGSDVNCLDFKKLP